MVVMKHKPLLTILLIMSTFIQPPTHATAEASPESLNSHLQAWLAPIVGLDEQRPAPAWINELRPVARFYQRVGFQPVWTAPHGLLPQGEHLLRFMANAFEAGLFSDAYQRPDIETICAERGFFSKTTPLSDVASQLQLDVVLTAKMLRYAQHLSQGQVMPETLSTTWLATRRPSTRDIPTELAQALREDRLVAYIESLHPHGQAYQDLRNALGRYATIKRTGGWPTIVPGPTLRKGDQGPRVAALKRRLKITEDLTGDVPADNAKFDAIVESAVARFQRRHGLTADGLVGERTRAELNVPVEDRITGLQLNMERWRWFPDSLGDRYLMVNIPAFSLHIVEANQCIDRLRAIVGKNRRETPILSGQMTYLELNPYWNIPRKIARTDILPKVIGDPTYLARQGIRIFDGWDRQARELDPTNIPWETISARTFPYRLRQDPSDLNALGQVKFMFPNHQSVYIHDTPGKALFNRARRSFSSGCVRLEAPLRLAQYLLSGQGWDRTRLESVVSQGQRQTVVLDNPIPVHLVYFTAWVDKDGTVNFREDIYNQDQQLLMALAKRPSNLVFCSNDAAINHLLAVSITPTHRTDSTPGALGSIASHTDLTGEMAGHPMTGI